MLLTNANCFLIGCVNCELFFYIQMYNHATNIVAKPVTQHGHRNQWINCDKLKMCKTHVWLTFVSGI